MRTLADLGEFGLIERIARVAGSVASPQVKLGIGDDAADAVLAESSVHDVTVDTSCRPIPEVRA